MTDNKINKSILLNWLSVSDDMVSLDELGKLIETRTNGQYKLIQQTTNLTYGKKTDTHS